VIDSVFIVCTFNLISLFRFCYQVFYNEDILEIMELLVAGPEYKPRDEFEKIVNHHLKSRRRIFSERINGAHTWLSTEDMAAADGTSCGVESTGNVPPVPLAPIGRSGDISDEVLESLHGSHLYQDRVPKKYIGRTYQILVQMIQQQAQIVIGLLRRKEGMPAGVGLSNYYVYTNPDKTTRLRDGDRMFYLSQIPPTIKDHSKKIEVFFCVCFRA
jgi:hypothetical protein